MRKRRLSADERVRIAEWLAEGLSQAEIARRLGRSPSTISREIRRGRDPETGVYLPRQDQTPEETHVAPPEPQMPDPEPSPRRSARKNIGKIFLRRVALGVYEVALGLFRVALTVSKFALGGLFVIFGVVQGGPGVGVLSLMLLAPFFVKMDIEHLVLHTEGAKEVSEAEAPELHALVARLAERAGLPKPRVCVLENDDCNAYAAGRRNSKFAAVVVTTALVRTLNSEEMAGILAHELAHIKHRDCITGSVAWVMAYCLFVWLVPAAFPLHWAVSREREYRADAAAARICGQPLALAEALEKIGGEDNPGGRWAWLWATHPPTRERVRRLREMAAVC